jgi:hypothetical protein
LGRKRTLTAARYASGMIRRRPFWLAFAAFHLLGAAWATALPVNGTYDESHHIARAYAVFSGQWRAGDASLRVPASLLPANPDCTWDPRPVWRPASCHQAVEGHGLVAAPSGAARYPPWYYLLVGAPIRVSPDSGGIIAARLLSVSLSAVLLGAAVAIAIGLGFPMLAAAAALVVTPMVVNLVGAINPNGLEISAAIVLFVALLGLLDTPAAAADTRRRAPMPRRTLLFLAGLAAFLLLTLRHLGPLLLAVDLAAIALLVGRQRAAAELRRRDTRRVLGGWVAVGALTAGTWLLVGGSPAAEVPRGPLPSLTAGDVADGIVTFRIPFYVEQLVGRFSYGETRISPWAIRLWYVLFAVVAGAAVWRGPRRLRLVLAGLILVSLAILVALELSFLPKGRWYAHGRYALPILVGVVLVAGWARRHDGRWYVPASLVIVAAPVHLYALARVMIRFQTGTGGELSTLGQGPWHAPSGTVLPLAFVLMGVALLVPAVVSRRVTAA